MENLLKDFDIPAKNPWGKALRRWRSAITVVKNRRRRFRMVADLLKRSVARDKIPRNQEFLRVAPVGAKLDPLYDEYGDRGVGIHLPEAVRQAGFEIDADELAFMVYRRDPQVLAKFGGVEGIARCLHVSLGKGISAVERPPFTVRKQIYGSNQFKENPGKTFWMFMWESLQDTTLIILMLCALASIGLRGVTERWPMDIYEGFGIIICIFLVVIVTAVSEYGQFLQFRDLAKEKKKISVLVTRGGLKQEVCIFDLLAGDVVHLYAGDQVPADGIFISGYSLLIDESCLTGESEPVNICKERPFLLSGTKVQDGSGKMLVTSVGMRTAWGKLMENLSEWGDDETPLQVKLNGIATIIGKVGLTFSVLVFVILTLSFLVKKGLHDEFAEWSVVDAFTLLNYVAFSVTVTVVVVPEGLPLAVTLSLAFALRKLMNEKVLVRHIFACETMGCVTCICTDKTGTLTTNHMTVEKLWICDEVITGSDNMEFLKSVVSDVVLQVLVQSIFINSTSEVVIRKDGIKAIFGSATESALLELGLIFGTDVYGQYQEFDKLRVDPFNSDKKKMSVLVHLPETGYRAFVKGAPEIILLMCDKVIGCGGECIPLSEAHRWSIMNTIKIFSTEALRTLCFAFKNLTDTSGEDKMPEGGYTLLAVIGLKDPLRPGVKDAVVSCLEAGINVLMVTGDNIYTAIAVAKECGILSSVGVALEGADFRCKTPEEMKELIPKLRVLARSSPLDKHILVTQLKNVFGEVVAVTGDGTNDAPALNDADIGLAMGMAGTEVAKESADIIILDDNFTTIVNLVKWGRAVHLNIQKFVQFQLTANVAALLLNVISACISGSAPFNAFQLLWISMVSDILGALALALGPPNDKILQGPPVGRHMKFITTSMWKNVAGQSAYQVAVLSVLKFLGKGLLKLHGSDADTVLNTFIFNSFVFCQVFNEINSREIEKLNVFHGMCNDWLFLAILTFVVIFQIIIVELLGFFANTLPLSWPLWFFSILIGSVSMAIAVVIKYTAPAVHTEAADYSGGYVRLPSQD